MGHYVPASPVYIFTLVTEFGTYIREGDVVFKAVDSG